MTKAQSFGPKGSTIQPNKHCHYCTVGCGCKAYTWPMNSQGGTAPDQNKFGVDLGHQQGCQTEAWYAPST
jgi:arsenite oxidase large subunit